MTSPLAATRSSEQPGQPRNDDITPVPRYIFPNEPVAVIVSHEAAHHAQQSARQDQHHASPYYSGPSPEPYRSASFADITATTLADNGQFEVTTQDMQPILAQASTPRQIVQHSDLPWDPVYSENWPRSANEVPSLSSVNARSRLEALGLDMRGDALVETDHMVAYLFKHFSEKPGKW